MQTMGLCENWAMPSSSLDCRTEGMPCCQVNPTSKTVEYTGAVVQHCKAVSTVAHGGQIVCDFATLAGIWPHLAKLGRHRVDLRPLQGLASTPGCAAAALDSQVHGCPRMDGALWSAAVSSPCRQQTLH